MRWMPIAAVTTATIMLLAGGPVIPGTSATAEAQTERAPVRLTIRPRHFLDAGTTVKPGTARYHNYARPENSQIPVYGFDPTGVSRHPQPVWYRIPGF